MVNYKILISLFLIMSSCNCDDDELSLTRMEYIGTELRTDGYFYSEIDTAEPWVDIYFFYKNGVILYGESPSISQIPNFEIDYASGDYHNRVKDIKYYWGVFKILGNEIEFERWYPGDPPLEVFVRAGTIIDNETFHITRSYRQDGTDEKVRDELFKFKAFSPKPDSTNTFID